jgi:hypothetical protein
MYPVLWFPFIVIVDIILLKILRSCYISRDEVKANQETEIYVNYYVQNILHIICSHFELEVYKMYRVRLIYLSHINSLMASNQVGDDNVLQ